MSTTVIDRPSDEDIKSLAEQGLTLPLTYHTLKHYLPHRYPFLLVDKVISCSPGECITAIKNVTTNEEAFNGHIPDQPIMPDVLLVGSMAQVSGSPGLTCAGLTARAGDWSLFAGVAKVRCKRRVIPGDQLIIRAKTVMQKQGIYKFDCTVHVEDELAASAQIMIARQGQ